MKKSIFEVIAKNTCSNLITKEKIYPVYSVSFSKLNPEGLFLIYCDNERWERFSSNWFKPAET